MFDWLQNKSGNNYCHNLHWTKYYVRRRKEKKKSAWSQLLPINHKYDFKKEPIVVGLIEHNEIAFNIFIDYLPIAIEQQSFQQNAHTIFVLDFRYSMFPSIHFINFHILLPADKFQFQLYYSFIIYYSFLTLSFSLILFQCLC